MWENSLHDGHTQQLCDPCWGPWAIPGEQEATDHGEWWEHDAGSRDPQDHEFDRAEHWCYLPRHQYACLWVPEAADHHITSSPEAEYGDHAGHQGTDAIELNWDIG